MGRVTAEQIPPCRRKLIDVSYTTWEAVFR